MNVTCNCELTLCSRNASCAFECEEEHTRKSGMLLVVLIVAAVFKSLQRVG